MKAFFYHLLKGFGLNDINQITIVVILCVYIINHRKAAVNIFRQVKSFTKQVNSVTKQVLVFTCNDTIWFSVEGGWVGNNICKIGRIAA